MSYSVFFDLYYTDSTAYQNGYLNLYYVNAVSDTPLWSNQVECYSQFIHLYPTASTTLYLTSGSQIALYGKSSKSYSGNNVVNINRSNLLSIALIAR